MSNDTFGPTIKTTSTFFKTLFISMSLMALSSASVYAAQQEPISDVIPQQKLLIQHGKFGDSLSSTDGRAVHSSDTRSLTITPANAMAWTPGDWSTSYAYMCDLLKNACVVDVESDGVTTLGLSFIDVLKKYADNHRDTLDELIKKKWQQEISVKYSQVVSANVAANLILSSGGDFAAYVKALAAYQEVSQNLFIAAQECEKDIPGSSACQWPGYPNLPMPNVWK